LNDKGEGISDIDLDLEVNLNELARFWSCHGCHHSSSSENDKLVLSAVKEQMSDLQWVRSSLEWLPRRLVKLQW